MAAYTGCLRCTGAPRRPTSGSGLSLTIPAWHAVLYDPGEFEHRCGPVLRCRHGLRRDLSGSALPKFPQSASRGARLSGLPGLLTLRPARLLAPLCRIEPVSRPQRAFTSGLSTVWSPSPSPGITTVATGRFHWRDFHPLDPQLASLHWFRAFAAHSFLACRPL